MVFPLMVTSAFGVFVLFYGAAVSAHAYELKRASSPRSPGWTDQFLKKVSRMRASIWGAFGVLVFDTFFFLLPSLFGTHQSRDVFILFGLSDLLYACLMFVLWRWTLRLTERALAEQEQR